MWSDCEKGEGIKVWRRLLLCSVPSHLHKRQHVGEDKNNNADLLLLLPCCKVKIIPPGSSVSGLEELCKESALCIALILRQPGARHRFAPPLLVGQRAAWNP